jgi:hypothetical protein
MTDSRATRRGRWLGATCVFLSFLALPFSLGAPGIGWTVTAVALSASSLLAPIAGRRQTCASLVLGIINLLTLGPLSLLGPPVQLEAMPMSFLAFFVVAPFLLAVCAILFAKNFRV